MATKEDYAAFSAIVYNNARGDENKLDLPANWTLLPLNPNSSITGFTAAAFQNTLTGEIVIAY